MVTENEQKLYDILASLGIVYQRYEHPPLFTVEDAEKFDIDIPGQHCKNLFLKNRKGDIHYLVVVDDQKRVDLKLLAKQIGSSSLSFASEERLLKYLGVTPGSVTPYAIINDEEKSVIVLVDSDLANASIVNFHPTINTATIGVSYENFEKFLKWHGNEFKYVEV
ncbi:prolyl-tRNA synthetase associated domain-containing protein [Clostridium sp. 19966]|uniref:prolyl-tRNA synthetase associated domain-containing protein n=1 Tax=Clostridium sp. 19966 TaxID=2768166 RepID=UPI0028DD4E7B|nr:prolyl-tRNA synthetase associated domain-containing protein [Clostridium sp. 19966]MDT8719056.1 prolyl-tRNA synthetase associated domain-containing protein [Clostridium sp. 19966]